MLSNAASRALFLGVTALFAVNLAAAVTSTSSLGVYTTNSNGVIVGEIEHAPANSHWRFRLNEEGFAGLGYYIWRSNGKQTANPNKGVLAFDIEVPADGEYEVRVHSLHKSGDGADGIFLWFDESDPSAVAGGSNDGWTWTTMGSSGPVRMQLSAGRHALFISGRSRDVYVDRWAIFRAGEVSESVWSDLSQEAAFVTTTTTKATTTTTTTTSTTTADKGAVIAVEAPRSDAPAMYRINVGGAGFQDSFGQAWDGDLAFEGGRQFRVDSPIANIAAADQALFRSERNGVKDEDSFLYRLLVPAGERLVIRLHFAEICSICASAPGDRVFTVTINNNVALKDFDILEATNGQADAPVTRSFIYEAESVLNEGVTPLELRFLRVKKGPKVNGIEVLRLRDTVVDVPTTTAASTASEEPSSTARPTTTTTVSYAPTRCARLHRDGKTCLRCTLPEEVPVGDECRRECPRSTVKIYDAGGNNPWCVPVQTTLDLALAGDFEVTWAAPRRFPRVFRKSRQVLTLDGSLDTCLKACRANEQCLGVFYNFERSKCIGLNDVGNAGQSHPSAFPALSLTLRRGGLVSPDQLAAAAGFENAFEGQPGRRFSTAFRRSDRVLRLENVSLEECLRACAAEDRCKGVYHEALLCYGLKKLGRPRGKPGVGRIYSYAKL